MKKLYRTVKQELCDYPYVYGVLTVILIGAFIVRVWRIDQLLGFYYDQGRDAKVIWDFWHNGKPFLIGPTTGIEGIFRGPWYYWLIAPWYLLGNGDPVWPSVFLSFTTIIAIFLLYLLGKEMVDRTTGLFAAFIGSFSYSFILASRWLSNPTPMLLISMLLVLSMFLVMQGKKWCWILIAFLLGQAMQFGSAAEVFYFPSVLIFAIWQRKNLPDTKTFLFSVIALFLVFLPQIVFDLRHEGILRQTIGRFLFSEKSFTPNFWEVIQARLTLYSNVFMSKLFLNFLDYRLVTAIATLLAILLGAGKLFRNQKFITISILLSAPLVGMLFFQGNNGNIYDYYFTGYYFIFVLFFAGVWGIAAQRFWLTRVGMAIFAVIFFNFNIGFWQPYLKSDVNSPNVILLENQKKIVDWVYKNAGNIPFNVDVYVPPVISHAYDYLFLWWGTTRYNRTPIVDRQLPLLYTVYEEDPPHPERLEVWLKRQGGIGKVQDQMQFGAITVQRRSRR